MVIAMRPFAVSTAATRYAISYRACTLYTRTSYFIHTVVYTVVTVAVRLLNSVASVCLKNGLTINIQVDSDIHSIPLKLQL